MFHEHLVPAPGQCCPICPGEYRDVEVGVVCLYGEWLVTTFLWCTAFRESSVPVHGQCCPICPDEYRDVEVRVVCLYPPPPPPSHVYYFMYKISLTNSCLYVYK